MVFSYDFHFYVVGKFIPFLMLDFPYGVKVMIKVLRLAGTESWNWN